MSIFYKSRLFSANSSSSRYNLREPKKTAAVLSHHSRHHISPECRTKNKIPDMLHFMFFWYDWQFLQVALREKEKKNNFCTFVCCWVFRSSEKRIEIGKWRNKRSKQWSFWWKSVYGKSNYQMIPFRWKLAIFLSTLSPPARYQVTQRSNSGLNILAYAINARKPG